MKGPYAEDSGDTEMKGLREQAGKICARQCTGTQGEAVARVGHSQGLLQ